MNCISCGKTLDPNVRFCSDCGTQIVDTSVTQHAPAISSSESEKNVCVSCGKTLKPKMRFCNCCGTQVTITPVTPPASTAPATQSFAPLPTAGITYTDHATQGAGSVVSSQCVNYQQPQQQLVLPATALHKPIHPPGHGMAIASMVLGIISVVFCWVFYFGIPCSIVGLVLGVIGKKKNSEAGATSGMATAGIVCSIIALAINILLITACAACFASLSSLGTRRW